MQSQVPEDTTPLEAEGDPEDESSPIPASFCCHTLIVLSSAVVASRQPEESNAKHRMTSQCEIDALEPSACWKATCFPHLRALADEMKIRVIRAGTDYRRRHTARALR